MADEPQTPDTDETLELTEEVAPPADEQIEEGEEEEVLVFGDEPAEAQDTDNATIRHLREELKKARKEAAEAKRPKQEEQVEDPGPRPSLEQFDWDEDKHAEALEAWTEKKLAAKSKTRQSTQDQAAQVEVIRQEIEQEKQALAKPDADEAFETVKDILTPEQQSILVGTLDKGNRAKVIYALAKNEDRLADLAGISDPIRFIKEVAKLEGQLKMVKRRAAPAIDAPERGSGKMTRTVTSDEKRLKDLEKLSDEGKLPDRTELIRLRKQLGKTA